MERGGGGGGGKEERKMREDENRLRSQNEHIKVSEKEKDRTG